MAHYIYFAVSIVEKINFKLIEKVMPHEFDFIQSTE